MSGKILNNIPVSGENPEFHFGDHFRYRLWVEFISNDFEKWIGCFSKEYSKGFDKVLIGKNNQTAFVIASGQGYLIDIQNHKLKFKTEEYPLIESAILTNNPNYFIAGTFQSVYVFDTEKLINETIPKFMVDGIYFKSQKENNAIGNLATAENQYDFNMGFKFDLETFEINLDQKVVRKQFGLFEKIKIVDKDYKEKTNILKRLISKIIK